MSSTADRWFVPHPEYYHTINDYALVRQSAASVREDILDTDDAPTRFVDPDATFMDEYYSVNFDSCYDFALPGRLVFADVDDEDPAHKEKVGEWAKEIPIEGESEKTTETKKELVKTLADVWFPQDDAPREDNEENMPEDQREQWTLRDLRIITRQGLLEAPVPSLIITAKTVEKKDELLNIMSGQIRRPTKRPVLALINMIDSKQTTEVGETQGWVTGYDFIKELLVIKPFTSKGGNHPLGAKWHGDVAQDGVSFSGTPQEFAKAYAELGETVAAGNKDDGFKMLVHTRAAEWIDESGKAFLTVYGADFEADLDALYKATKKIKEAMDEIKFPAVEKNEKERGLEIPPFLWLQNIIETEEAAIRDAAVDAKERGEEKVAQNAAKLYEHIHTQIKAFNQNPSMDL